MTKKINLYVVSFVLTLFLSVGDAYALEYNYDSIGRLTSIQYDNLDSISYVYDSAGNLTSTTTYISPDPALSVTSPNGLETWQAGLSHDIRWDSVGAVGSNVKLELFRDGVSDSVISSSTLNDGVFAWAIPASLNACSNCKIKVSSLTQPVVFDSSDDDFTIATVLSSVVISGPSHVDENTSANYVATASYADGSSSVVTNASDWSEDSNNASINSAGTLNAAEVISDSAVEISVSHTDSGVTKTTTTMVTINNIVPPVTLNSLSITGVDSFSENSTAIYIATAGFSDGSMSVISNNASWDENTAFTSINTGVLNAQSVNADSAVVISASYTYSGITLNTTKVITVRNLGSKILDSVSISGASTVREGKSSSFGATAYFKDGTSGAVTNQSFWSENSIYTTINQGGVLNANSVNSDISLSISARYSYNGVTKAALKSITILDVPAGQGALIVPILQLLLHD